MTDLSTTVAPKSDQLNSDDLIAGARTIKITGVKADPGSTEQPIAIYFDGDNGKPYKPCKSMRRVMIQVWGTDGAKYAGRSMTLYRDPKVLFGGLAVGGIRISHMSHMDGEMTMALTATRASRKPYTVKPLVVQETIGVDVPEMVKGYAECATKDQFDALEDVRRKAWGSMTKTDKETVKTASDAANKRLSSISDAIPVYDIASATKALREAGSLDDIDAVWKDITADYRATGREVPIDVEALRNELRESFC